MHLSVFRALRIPVVVVAAVLGLAGCKDLTSVEAPDAVQPDDYATAAGATALAAGAITQFHSVFGSGDNQVLYSGVVADELTVTSGITTGWEWDSRNPQDPSPSGRLYTGLHETRQRLLYAIATFQRVASDSSARIGQLFALLGYTGTFLGENFCAGVPLSHRDADLRPVYGQPLTTAQLFDSVLTAFDSAIVYGADSARIAHLAQVGRGRALLNLGRFSEAADAVAEVPTSYVYDVTFLMGTLHNGLLVGGGNSTEPLRWVTVPEREGTNGANWRSSGGAPGAYDPRAVLVNRSPELVGEDEVTEIWQSARYQVPDAPIRLAGGIEARLIEAEAALQAGDPATWLAGLNALRALGAANGGADGLAPLADPASAAGRVDLHFSERALWLFLTGHRHGDLRRLVRQYGRAPEATFPTGGWRDGILYGPATSMAPPAAQAGNPNYSGCLDREA